MSISIYIYISHFFVFGVAEILSSQFFTKLSLTVNYRQHAALQNTSWYLTQAIHLITTFTFFSLSRLPFSSLLHLSPLFLYIRVVLKIILVHIYDPPSCQSVPWGYMRICMWLCENTDHWGVIMKTWAFEAKLSSQRPFPTSQALLWATDASVLQKQLVTHIFYLKRKSFPRGKLKQEGPSLASGTLQTKHSQTHCLPSFSSLLGIVAVLWQHCSSPFLTPCTSGQLDSVHGA